MAIHPHDFLCTSNNDRHRFYYNWEICDRCWLRQRYDNSVNSEIVLDLQKDIDSLTKADINAVRKNNPSWPLATAEKDILHEKIHQMV